MASPPVPLKGAGTGYHLAGGQVTVDLDALVWNYRKLAALCAPAATAAVVKADAYGLGADHVVPALARAGCDRFFVALPEEGLAVRALAPKAQVLVFNGLFGADAAAAYVEAGLTPVLNSHSDIAIWEAAGWDGDKPLPCAIHVDTGMNRLGLTIGEATALAEDNALTRALRPMLIMSHLACADDPAHPLNARQLESFQQVRALFSGVDSSLANSAGIFLGSAWHGEITRPGIALYGSNPVTGTKNPMRPVATVQAKVVQLRLAASGECVGYGATQALARDTAIAVAAAGYADGYHRAASGAGVPLRDTVAAGGHGFVNGHRAPILGRVTMDLTMFDVTDLPAGSVAVGDHVELFGPNIPIDETAAAAGTIAYELLTGLGARYHRSYVGSDS